MEVKPQKEIEFVEINEDIKEEKKTNLQEIFNYENAVSTFKVSYLTILVTARGNCYYFL